MLIGEQWPGVAEVVLDEVDDGEFREDQDEADDAHEEVGGGLEGEVGRVLQVDLDHQDAVGSGAGNEGDDGEDAEDLEDDHAHPPVDEVFKDVGHVGER